jgi:hypothetical protein
MEKLGLVIYGLLKHISPQITGVERGGPKIAAGLYRYCCKQFHFISFLLVGFALLLVVLLMLLVVLVMVLQLHVLMLVGGELQVFVGKGLQSVVLLHVVLLRGGFWC